MLLHFHWMQLNWSPFASHRIESIKWFCLIWAVSIQFSYLYQMTSSLLHGLISMYECCMSCGRLADYLEFHSFHVTIMADVIHWNNENKTKMMQSSILSFVHFNLIIFFLNSWMKQIAQTIDVCAPRMLQQIATNIITNKWMKARVMF